MKTIYTAEQLKSVYGEPQSVATQPVEQPKGENIFKSIAKDVAGTLVVNPVTRATEAVTRLVAPESQAAKGYEMLQQEGQGQDVLGVNVPSLTGGARQITGEALKTASYLFPYGKAAGLAGKGLGTIGGNVAAGATGGYLADVGYGLTDKEQTMGEALTPGLGTAIGGAIPLVGPTLRATGRATAKLGGKAVESVIPVSKREAGILQTYKANNPFFKRVADVLKGTEKAPTTAGVTTTTQGLVGTKSGIGVQAKRASDKLWNDVISPRLKASEQAVDLDGFFAKIQDDIIANNPEVSRQKSLLNALQSFKDDYAGINSVSLEKLQKLKEGWAEFVPEKFYKGQNIAGNAKQVQALMANEARQTIYSQLGDDVKQAYFDYGNLQGLKELGKVSMTGQRLKGGTGGLASELFSQVVTPIGTVGGQAVYKLGKGIEFIGNLGAKNLGEALGVNVKFPGDAAVDDISKSIKKIKSLPNKQGGFARIGQDANLPIKTQSSQTASKVKNTVIPKLSPNSATKSIDNTIADVKQTITTYKNMFTDPKTYTGKQALSMTEKQNMLKHIVDDATDTLKSNKLPVPKELANIKISSTDTPFTVGDKVLKVLRKSPSKSTTKLIAGEDKILRELDQFDPTAIKTNKGLAFGSVDDNFRLDQLKTKMKTKALTPAEIKEADMLLKKVGGSSSLKGKGVIPETNLDGTKNLKWDTIPEGGVKVMIPLDKIRVTSSALEKATNNVKIGNGSRTSGPVDIAMLKDGTFAIEEGHHRIVQRMLQGDKNIEALVHSTKHSASPDSIYNKLDTTFIKKASPETNLINEAKKYPTKEGLKVQFAKEYKTLDEYIKSVGTPVYHGTNIKNATMIETKPRLLTVKEQQQFPTTVVGDTQIGISTSKDKAISEYFASLQPTGKGKVVELVLPNYAKIYKLPDNINSIDELGLKQLQVLKNRGFDAIEDVKNIGGENEIRVINPSILKTKSQLEDIWKKANSKANKK